MRASHQRDVSVDGFLGGRLVIAQPRKGFRAGHDTVLLAAAVPAEAGESVLELGAGAGVASLCLAARAAGTTVLGLERDQGLVDLANENAARNALAGRVFFECADVEAWVAPRVFDHVFFNPPFHPESGSPSPILARHSATRAPVGAIAKWSAAALRAVRAGGTVTAVLRADRAGEMLSLMPQGAVVFPLFPRAGEAAKRIIVRSTKGCDRPTRVAAGLVLHGEGGNTDAAEAVLRHGAPLGLA